MSRLLLLFACFGIFAPGESTEIYNSSVACFSGAELQPHISATCQKKTTEEIGIIAVRQVFIGAKPKTNQCSDTDPASSCCQYAQDDCFLDSAPDDKSIYGCSGYRSCEYYPDHSYIRSQCSPVQVQGAYDYSLMEYECVNSGLMNDFCHDGMLMTQPEVYINSNVRHVNTEHHDKSCTCMVTTLCGASVIVEAVDIRLKKHLDGHCVETLSLYDEWEDNHNTPEHLVKKTCLDKNLNGFKEIFRSQTNTAILNMTIIGNHTGKVWIKAKASWPNATVQLRCGAAFHLETMEEHECPGDDEDTSPTTTSTTTATNVQGPVQEKDSDNQDVVLSPGAIAGIIAAGVAIFLIILIMLILIFRRHKSSESDHHDYDTPTFHEPDYETLRYNNLNGKAPAQLNGISNPAYNTDMGPTYDNKVNLVGASPDFSNLGPPAAVEYDNLQNDAVMVMPKGAVM